MNEIQLCELIARVEAFEIDEGSPLLPFAKRLGRENGWTVGYANRVVREYKRFAILAVTAGHAVTPSEDVDQAWHLHLTYTRSYWERFCRDVLGTPLHHNPTAGGVTEHRKFFQWYVGTLASYERMYGERPPDDIWPHPARRFAHAGAGRWVDPSRYWLIPKLRFRPQRWLRNTILASSFLIPLVFVGCGIQGIHTLNPFGRRDTEFLVFYIALIVIGLIVSVWCRTSLPLGECKLDSIEDRLAKDPYVIAALANGPRGVVLTAIGALFVKGHLHLIEVTEKKFLALWTSKRRRLVRGDSLPETASELERLLFAAADEKGDVTPQQIVEAGLPIGETYHDQLEDAGLVDPDPPPVFGADRIALYIMHGVLLVGIIKLAAGTGVVKFGVRMHGAQTFGVLLALMVATGWSITSFFTPTRHTTPCGRKLLRELKKQHAGLRTSEIPAEPLTAHDVALSTALFGAAVWQNQHDGLAELHQMMEEDGLLRDPASDGDGYGGCGGGVG